MLEPGSFPGRPWVAWRPALSARLTTTPHGKVPKDSLIQEVFTEHLLYAGSVLGTGK